MQRRLREEAHARTQGPDELAADFMTRLLGILSHLETPLPIADQLDLA